MNIKIKNLRLLNFKGIRDLLVNFGDVTNIYGENGTGKTTIVDAFAWLMFGKSSTDAKDFNIKTLDKFNQPIHKLQHEVSATMAVDDREMHFRRIFKEKWVKKQGQSESEFTGHETEYFVDDVPLSQKEYGQRVDFLLNEGIAKMITSPTYFNSLKWQDRRTVLETMAGTISNEDIAGNNADFKKLITAIGNEKEVDFKKRIAAKKTKLKDSLKGIPTRIDEAKRSMPQVEDNATIEKEIAEIQKQITAIDRQMEDKTASFNSDYQLISDRQREKRQLESKLQEKQYEQKQETQTQLQLLKTSITGLLNEIKADKNEVEGNNKTISFNNNRINQLNLANTGLRTEWNEENAKQLVIDDHEYNCPTCKQKLPEGNIEQLRETFTSSFNTNKSKKLASITETGKNNTEEIERIKQSNEVLRKEIAQIEAGEKGRQIELDKLLKEQYNLQEAPAPEETGEMKLLRQQIAAVVIPAPPVIDHGDLKVKKEPLIKALDALKARLANQAQIARLNERIAELEAEEKTQAQELAELEQLEFTLAAFSKARIETIEERINGKFQLVRFKMFEQQINGGETESCECMVDGVPYSDLNTASRINAGIDIINALTEHYKINAPVFIDNRESVINLLPCKSQIINLIVSEGVKKLKVEAAPLQNTTASLFN